MEIEYAFIQVHLPPISVPVSDGHPYNAIIAGPMVTLICENGKWLCDSGEESFREVEPPPPEVIVYLESLLLGKYGEKYKI